jgi:hypothetical protein
MAALVAAIQQRRVGGTGNFWQGVIHGADAPWLDCRNETGNEGRWCVVARHKWPA